VAQRDKGREGYALKRNRWKRRKSHTPFAQAIKREGGENPQLHAIKKKRSKIPMSKENEKFQGEIEFVIHEK